jgi:protein-tyrosine phosphatase
MINVLFVCLGNVCRSPMAEAVFKDLVDKAGLSDQFHIDSVGTSSYHVGDLVYPGTRRILSAHGIQCNSISRQITRTDLREADYVIAMDHHNISDVKYMMRGMSLKNHVSLLLDFASNVDVRDVPDPYYTDNYEEAYRLVDDGCRGLLAHIREERGI